MLKTFMQRIKMKGRADRTLITLEQALYAAEKHIGKPLHKATFEDIVSFIDSLKGNSSDNTIALYESKLIQFYRYCFDETDNIKYNKMVKRLKNVNMKIQRNHINPSDILLPEDVKRLINAATLERDRCIVAVLFESGMRRGELIALTKDMVIMDDAKQEVTFNIPDEEGCKTGGRTVVCLEIYGYVQDWMKCNTSDKFMPMSESNMRYILSTLSKRVGLKKPCNPHMFRHSAITHAVNIGMQQNAISERFWGTPNSDMLSTYIHLSEQMQANAYRNAKGMNGNEVKVINPLACRCVECGKLIQAGNLCKQCEEIKSLKEQVQQYNNVMKAIVEGFNSESRTPINIGFDGKKLVVKN